MLRMFCLLFALGLFLPARLLIAPASAKENEVKSPALTVGERSTSKFAKEIAALVSRQEQAWNKGDLDAFLGEYLKSAQVTYVSNGSVKRGYDAIREHYLKRYGNSKSSMGALRLSDLEISDIGDKHVLCIGKFTVIHHAHVPIYGRFSLIFVKSKGAWKIMYDHSSQ